MITWIKELVGSKKQVRYLISGGIGFISEYSIFLVLYLLSHALILSNSISFICALLITFFLHKKWSFKGDHKLQTKKQFVLYVILATVNFILTNLLIVLFVHHFHIKAYIAKVLVELAIVCWNYFIINRFIFSHIEKG
jgi:putative flippase GtrA